MSPDALQSSNRRGTHKGGVETKQEPLELVETPRSGGRKGYTHLLGESEADEKTNLKEAPWWDTRTHVLPLPPQLTLPRNE
ncbi:hypothetical protein EB796_005744 [Bugula neritina]|uniref:Uncharacterized protein n=1 Tax=Bugula neritina TaxID=10212 RepID=A0A7J7KCN6_BUGNE|nr:hypothetical protein EB796_005744 [Bugula neritina]